MSAPSIQPDVGSSAPNTDRQVLDAAIALAPAISLEHVLQEAAQQIRRVANCDAIAIALYDANLDQFQLAHRVGFDEDRETLAASLTPSWRRALNESAAVARDLARAMEITVPMLGGDVHGVVTVIVSGADSSSRIDELEQAVASVATQVASAIERAEVVNRLGHKRRLEAIGEVSAGIARELRNPLFGISSAAQLLRFRVRDDPVIEKNVGRILREVERLNGVVGALLEYGRPEPIRVSPADPDGIWHNVLGSKRGLLESKALVARHRPAEPRATVDIDTEQIAHVFVSVLSNAVDAAPEGSDLTLTSSTLPGGAWRCRLHNDGPPISPDLLPRVFELFFTTKPGGSGLGLALCQRILDDHGGTISLDSTADAGTTVTITLPNRKMDGTADTHD
ncbi:MAG TPA: ATP-binding protein [Gemmatimonadaceae bacterium]|nr:ATP-binding protein [Gemmatimonadaceae bacterium]